MGHQCPLFAFIVDLKNRIKSSINKAQNSVFLRKDFNRFGSYRQVSRVLNELESQNVIQRSGYGVYAKMEITGDVKQFLDKVKNRLNKRSRRTVMFNGQVVQLGTSPKQLSNAQTVLDDVKLRLAKEIVRRFDLQTIRQKSLDNLSRWEKNDVWCSAFDEWRKLLKKGSDNQLLSMLTSNDETANRLRQSAPYTGLLDKKTVERIRETPTA